MPGLGILPPVRTGAPPASPIAFEQAKLHLRVEHDEDDDLIQAYLEAATRRLDGWDGLLGRCLTLQTWRQDLPSFPACDFIRLPFPDVQSVASVTHLDAEGETQTMDPSGYVVVNDARGGALVLKSGASWPDTSTAADAVKITFEAGYGATENPMPAALRAAILLHVGLLYDHRAAVDADTLVELPLAYSSLIAQYRRLG